MRNASASIGLLGLMCMIALVGCGGEEAGADDASCVSDKEYFSRRVWKPVLEQRCFSCHNGSGVAKYSKLVFQPSSQTGHIEANFKMLQDAAQYETNGKSIVLQKPLGQLAHQGGVVLAQDSEEFKAIATMLERFESPSSCDASLTVEDHFKPVRLLDPQQTLRKTTLNLGGRLPTEDEILRVEQEGLDVLDQIVEDLAGEPTFYARLEEMFNDMLLTERYINNEDAVSLLSRDIFPDARWFQDRPENDLSGEDPEEVSQARRFANRSVALEPLKLISYIVREDRPFTEIITADYMIFNPFSARVYGATGVTFEDKLDPEEWRPGTIPGQPHAGVLTSAMFLNRFPTTPTNRNRHRSRMVYQFFLATDVMALAERPLDPTSIADFNPTLYNPQCTSCHGVIDPIAGAFQNWNESGMYQPPESGWFEDMLPPGFGNQSIRFEDRAESLPWAAAQIAADPRFAVATVHNVYRGLTGHQLINPLADSMDAEAYEAMLLAQEVQQRHFDDIAADFVATNYNLKTVIKHIVKSPYFRADGTPTVEVERQDARYSGAGTGRMLTPELLNRKITAVTGSPWTEEFGRTNAFLLRNNQYRLLYGGIDSNDVTQRITEPNGIMANIQWRMANEMACRVTARDFVQPEREQRRFFKLVDPSFAPEDNNGFDVPRSIDAIKRNIQHLHWHFLGERLSLEDPELERTYQLFYDVWKDGNAAMQAGDASRELEGRCRAERDFVTNEEYPEAMRIRRDDQYTIRAWQAVVTYLLSDYKFLYE